MSEDRSHAAIDVAQLRAIPLLAPLDDSLLAEVAERFVSESYSEDRVVIQQGDRGDTFYLIARGKVAVTQTTPGSETRQLAVLQDGDYFGEVALLKDVPRTATVRTLVPTDLLSLQRAQFLSLLERAPGLRESLERMQENRSGRRSDG